VEETGGRRLIAIGCAGGVANGSAGSDGFAV